MIKRKVASITIILLTFVFGNLPFAQSFTVDKITGTYNLSLSGTLSNIDVSTGQIQVTATTPMSSIGYFVANGDGTGRLTSVVNIGGIAIVNLVTEAGKTTTYTLDATTGIWTAVTPMTVDPNTIELPYQLPPPGLDLTGTANYEFRFTVKDANAEELDVIGAKLVRPDGTPVGAFVGVGSASRQTTTTQ
jgi:hypothetical protein